MDEYPKIIYVIIKVNYLAIAFMTHICLIADDPDLMSLGVDDEFIHHFGQMVVQSGHLTMSQVRLSQIILETVHDGPVVR